MGRAAGIAGAFLVLAVMAPRAVEAGSGVLQVDDYWYAIDLDATVAWRHDLARIDLPTAVASSCQRPGGGAPLSGTAIVAVGGGPQLLYTDLPVQTSPTEPHIRVRSVSGDLVCAGGTLSPIVFRDGFE